jgi:hypothetical protein
MLAAVSPMGDRLAVISWVLHDRHPKPARELREARRDSTGQS